MSIFMNPPPVSLYIHLPWCVRKCPYCDFNSHEIKNSLPETEYVQALSDDLVTHLELIQDRPIESIFFGGGTPSLFSGNAIAQILDNVEKHCTIPDGTEITLESNPGTIDYTRFQAFKAAGINRISLGIQSLQDEKLKTLGRIHNSENAQRAIQLAIEAGFSNFNLDLMFGLPNQSIKDALYDLETALSFEPKHVSWYQLTIEPNTFFYHETPTLPDEETIWEMQLSGKKLLQAHGFDQYEVSAYAKKNYQCKHNYNYWSFGDYLGIGAGAHSKITCTKTQKIFRFAQVKHPKDYLDTNKRMQVIPKPIETKDLIFEFMLNALRLEKGFESELFTERTGIPVIEIVPTLNKAKARGLLIDDENRISATPFGKRFLNDLVGSFLPY